MVQKAHLAMIDALMTLAAKETVSQVKMAVEVEQMGVGAPWENALLFWVNRVRKHDTHNLFTIIKIPLNIELLQDMQVLFSHIPIDSLSIAIYIPIESFLNIQSI